MGDRIEPGPYAAREAEDWATVVQEQITDLDLPEIVPFDPDLDDAPEDTEYGCAGVSPDEAEGDATASAINTLFGRLWPHCDAKNHLVTVRAPVSGARFPVHAGIAPIMVEGLRRQEHGIGGPAYLCKPAQCGAFNCRPIGGTRSPSNHSGALAVDINWTDNPFRKGARYAIPEWVWRMWESLGYYWGGRYSDFMHVEYLKSPAEANEMVQRLGGGGGRPVIERGATGDAVRKVQDFMGIPVTNVFDAETERVVRAYQQDSGLDPDGIVGNATWNRMEQDMSKIDDIHHELTFRLPNRRGDGSEWGDSVLGYATNGDAHSWHAWKILEDVVKRLERIEAALPKAPTR